MDSARTPNPAADATIREFLDAVAQAAPDELKVVAVRGGFDVVYREELTQRGLLMSIDSTFRAAVRCNATARTFTMADVGIVRHSDLGGLQGSVSGSSGRMYASRTVEAVGRREDGTFGTIDSQHQDTRVLHAAVREPAAVLGWTEKEPATAQIGKVVAIIAGVGLVIGALVVGVLAVSGAFS